MLRRTVLTGAGSAALIGLAGARAARADVMDEVKKRGTLVVGMEAAYVPYEFFKDGKIIGYDPDIIDHFIPKLGVKAQLVDTAWNGIADRRCRGARRRVAARWRISLHTVA